jgi:hypothetical protein
MSVRLSPILKSLQNTRGVMFRDISVSILKAGVEVFEFIQDIEPRYRIGGNGSMSPACAVSAAL